MNEIKKIIKIFLASSIDELKAERNELGRFILGINNLNLERGVYCYLELCENDDNAMSRGNCKQDDYNRFIENEADAVFVLFHSKAGKYTMQELELARNCYRLSGKPKVYTYFKNFDEKNLTPDVKRAYDVIANEYQHFFGTFESIASVEVDILRAMFEICNDELLEVREENGTIYLGEHEIMDADDLDYIQNNKAIEQLKNKISGLKTNNPEYTDGLYGDEIDDEIEKCEKMLKDRYGKCFKALEDRFNSITTQACFDQELQDAYNASAKGDYKKVIEIIDRAKLQIEVEKALKEQKIIQKTMIDTTLNKYKQRINALAQTKVYDELECTYDDAVRAIIELHLYEIDATCLDLWYDYVMFLKEQNKSITAIEKGELLYLKSLECISKIDQTRLAELLTCLGLLYIEQNSFDKAEKYCLDAVKIYENLPDKDSEQYKKLLSESYYAVATFYYYQEKPDGLNDDGFYEEKQAKLEEFDFKAMKLREQLATHNPSKYRAALAQSYNGVSLNYERINEFAEAEEYHLKAISLWEQLYSENPEKYSGDLAKNYYTTGRFYSGQDNLTKAEQFLLKSVEIRERLVEENAKRYSADLAKSYSDTSILYKKLEKYSVAEEYYLKAIAIREKLAKENPERYNCYLVISYNLYAELKNDEDYFKRAYDIAKNAFHNSNSQAVYNKLKSKFDFDDED